MIIAYVADEHYLPYLKRSMESVRKYNKDAKFAVLSRNICQKQLPYSDVRCFIIDPGQTKFKFRQNDRMHEGVYYKFYLPKLPYDKVLYMDCDVLCQRPLNDLWEEKCPFICATESHIYGKVQAAELGLNKYALTGMMLLNLKALRKADFTQKCLDKLNEVNPHWHDETIINLLFNDKIRFIDKKFNYCRDRIYDNPIQEQDAYLLHYVGGQKREMLQTEYEELIPLKTLLKGKSVAIVGNSSNILKKTQGKAIDAHDVVIRFNKGFPNDKVGHKTTLLFLACTLTPEEMKSYNARYTIRRSKLCQNACDFNVTSIDRARLKQNGGQPSTGFLAVDFALGCNCKKIDLYGFDFFKSPTYYNPVGYQTLHNGNKEQERILELEKGGLVCIR